MKSTRARFWAFFASVAAGFAAVLGGCDRVGSKAVLDPDSRVEAETSSLHSVQVRDAQKSAAMQAVGPTTLSFLNADGSAETVSAVPLRQIRFTRSADGEFNFAVASGTDITSGGAEYSPETGKLKIGAISTSASSVITALSPAMVEQIKANKDVYIAQIQAATDIADSLKGVLIEIITRVATGGAL